MTMTTAAAHSVLRLALRAMLMDATYPEAYKARAYVDTLLDAAAWGDDARCGLSVLAIRWAQHCDPRQALTLREALGEQLTEKERLVLERATTPPSARPRPTSPTRSRRHG